MSQTLKEWSWFLAAAVLFLYPILSEAGSVRPQRPTASSESIRGVPIGSGHACKQLKEDIDEVAGLIQRRLSAEYLLSIMKSEEEVDALYHPGFHAYFSGLIKRAGKAKDIEAWKSAEYKKCVQS